jgi:hypothetical protein
MSRPAGTLAQRIAEKIDAGLLPTAKPQKVWAGYGRRAACSACEQPMLPAQTEYEFADATGTFTYRFHIGCYGLWEAACRRRGFRREPD